MFGGFIAFWAFFRLLRAALIDAPQWIVGFFACCCLSLAIWLHRRRRASCNLSGGVVAATILARHQIDTQVYRVQGWMADCYYPKKNAILLSPGNFEGMTVSALGIAAHEVGHVLQRKHGYVPYWLTWLIHKPAHVALAACLWLWLIGAAAAVQPFVHAGVGCFAFYLLYLLLELVCEIDASRRGVWELLRRGFLRDDELRIARRILRLALGTYMAAFAGATVAFLVLLPQLHWRVALPGSGGSAPTAPHRHRTSARERADVAEAGWPRVSRPDAVVGARIPLTAEPGRFLSGRPNTGALHPPGPFRVHPVGIPCRVGEDIPNPPRRMDPAPH